MARLTLSAICKSYDGAAVLRDIGLEVRDGEFLTLLGPSGCGKSTLLRIIAGLVPEDSGEIALDGRPLQGLAPRDRNIAMVFQDYALYPQMTVAQNIALPLLVTGLGPLERLPLVQSLWPRSRRVRRAVAQTVRATADSLGLDGLLARLPHQLSGGQRQRVALARAIVRRPHVFLLDEPFSNLDAKLRVRLRAEIAELHQRLGGTFVFVTHDQAEAMTLSDRIAVMMDGALLQLGTPEEIYERPSSLAVAEFIGSPAINLFHATLEAGRLVVRGSRCGLAPGAPDGDVILAARPEAIGIADAGFGVPAVVSRIEYLGAERYLYARISDPQAVETSRPDVAMRLPDAVAGGFRVGAPVTLVPDLDKVHLFDPRGARIAGYRPTVDGNGTAAAALAARVSFAGRPGSP